MNSTVSHQAQDANRAVARWWSETMLEPGAACILDVETTGFTGAIIEIAVIDAATGETLLNTLVDPGPVPIEPGAQAVHGISVDDLVDAPTWSVVWDQLLTAVGDRTVLAYNAFIRQVRCRMTVCRSHSSPRSDSAGVFSVASRMLEFRQNQGRFGIEADPCGVQRNS